MMENHHKDNKWGNLFFFNGINTERINIEASNFDSPFIYKFFLIMKN